MEPYIARLGVGSKVGWSTKRKRVLDAEEAEEASRARSDPYATAKTADNHWIVTGPHIMVFGPPSKTLGYMESKEPDPNKPYMMWSGTPYEHAMIPVAPAK